MIRIVSLLALGALVGWLASPAGEAPAGDAQAALRARIEADRRAKENYFRDHSWSPLRAFARYDFPPLEPGLDPAAIAGAAERAAVRLDAPGIAPEQLRIGVLRPETDRGPYRFRLERLSPGGDVRVDGEPLPESGHGAVRVVPEETKIQIGPFAIRPYVQAEAGILILFDRRRTEAERFVPPAHFPVDPAWRFRVPMTRIPDPETLPMQTSLGRVKEYRRVGFFEIETPPGSAAEGKPRRGGAGGSRKVRVYAYQPAFLPNKEEGLTVLFTDLTTGKGSYPVGRYIDLAPPEDGLHTLDFNAAYNPLCAYTHVYNCPIPPRENALPIAVRAGEMDYPGHSRH